MPKISSRERGFTLTELLIVVAIVAIIAVMVAVVVGGGLTILSGNFYYTEAGVLEAIQVDHPEARRVLEAHRNVKNYSLILVENEDGSRSYYELDTNILYNYRFPEN